jgi:hypothetical protein
MPGIRVEQPLPFAPATLQAANARRWRGFYDNQGPRPQPPPTVRLHADPAAPTGAGECDNLVSKVGNAELIEMLKYEVSPWGRRWRAAKWFLLLLMIVFIAIIVGLMAHVFSQMQAIYDEVTAAESGGSLTAMMQDAAHATASMSAASVHVLEMARTAHATLDSSVPVMTNALNKSVDMVEQLSSFSSHPRLTIAAG